jgi:hypothetical protein
MNKEQIDLIFKMLPINPQLDNIFLVLNQAYDILKQQNKDMNKELDIRDIDIRIFEVDFLICMEILIDLTQLVQNHFPFLKCTLIVKEKKFIS